MWVGVPTSNNYCQNFLPLAIDELLTHIKPRNLAKRESIQIHRFPLYRPPIWACGLVKSGLELLTSSMEGKINLNPVKRL